MSLWRSSTSSLFIASSLLISGPCFAAVSAADFDKDDTGTLNNRERRAYFIHLSSEVHQKVDEDKDGDISAAEMSTFLAKVEKSAKDKYLDATVANPKIDERKPIRIAELDKVFKAPEPETIGRYVDKGPERTVTYGGLLLRKDHEDVSVLKNATVFQRAGAANFSLSKDLEKDNDAFLGKGALIYPVLVNFDQAEPSSKNFVMTAFSITPSLSFDILANSNNAVPDKGSLTSRLGTEAEFGGGGLFDAQYWRLNGLYARDSRFQAAIAGGEAQWEPVMGDLGIGTSRDIFGGKVAYVLRTIAHAEAGDVIDAAGNKKLEELGGFVRLGTKLDLSVWLPGPLDRFTAFARYMFLEDVSESSEDSELFETGLNYLVNDAGNVKLGVQYRHGEIPLVLDKVDILWAGLEVKY